MRPNLLKEKLAAGKPAYGPVCTLGSIESVEIACHCGFDFVFIDGQHGAFNRDQMREAIRAVHTTDVTAVARPSASSGSGQIEFLLDAGYLTLMVAMVNTSEHARRLVDAAYYPPIGHRSTGSTRSTLYYGREYYKHSNDQLLLMAFIEHIDGVRNVEEIAATSGISGCFIGTNDLAISMGLSITDPSGIGPPEFEQIISKVLEATRKAGKVAGIHLPRPDVARCRQAQGFQVMTVDYEHNMIATAYRKLASELSETDALPRAQCRGIVYGNTVNDV